MKDVDIGKISSQELTELHENKARVRDSIISTDAVEKTNIDDKGMSDSKRQ